MYRYLAHYAAISVMLGLLGTITLTGQTTTSGDSLFVAMPGVVMPQIAALGERVRRPGKEKIIFVGRTGFSADHVRW